MAKAQKFHSLEYTLNDGLHMGIIIFTAVFCVKIKTWEQGKVQQLKNEFKKYGVST